MQSDFELLREYQRGSQGAFAALVARHVDWIFSVAFRRVGDAQMAEDLTQVVFIALATEKKWREGSNMPAWLFQTIRYAAAKALRAKARRQRHEAEASRHEAIGGERSDAQWEAIAPLLETAVGQLGAPDRQAILLRFYQRQSFAEIGMALAISEEGARKRVSRALVKLRKYFGAHGAVVSGVELASVLLEKTTGAAPGALAELISKSAAIGLTREAKALARGLRLAVKVRAAAFVLAGILGISAISTVSWVALHQQATERSHLISPAPVATSEPTTRPTDITFAQVIAGVKLAESSMQNLYIKNFDTTISNRADGASEWVLTPMHYAGSAWYDGNVRGRVRIYFSDEVMSWDNGVRPWNRQIEDVSWNGKEGRHLTIGSESTQGKMMRMRQMGITADLPSSLRWYSRWETGAGFTLQYMVMREEGAFPIQPRKPLSEMFDRAVRFNVAPKMTRQIVNGFDTVFLYFGGAFGSNSYWFDPSRGYSLIKVQEELNLSNQRRTEGWEVQRLKEIHPGIWFPLKASRVERDGPASYRRYNYQAEDAVANDPNFDDAIFTAPIPSGWFVSDNRTAVPRSYVEEEDGSQLEIHKGSAMPRIKVGVAKRPDGGAAVIPGPAWW